MTRRIFPIAGIAAAIGLTASAFAEWPFQTGDIILVSPSIADLNGDGSLEIVFGSIDGNLYCLDIHGQSTWETALHDGTGFPPQLQSSPALAQIDDDPTTLEIVIGSDNGLEGQLYCVGSDGSVLGMFTTPTAVFSSPLIVDLDNDGVLEIVFGNVRSQFGPPAWLYCINPNFQNGKLELVEKWSISLLDGSVFHSAATGDLNSDGVMEIIVSLGGTTGTSSDNSALFCLNPDGREIWSFHSLGSFTYNTPAIADIDDDGLPDVLVAPFNGDVHCLNGLDGNVKWIFDQAGASLLHSPACAQLDDDPAFETVIGSYGADILYCIDETGRQQWQHSFRPEWTSFCSPAIGDVNGDGDLEIAIGTGTPQQLGTSTMYLFDDEGDVIWSKQMPAPIASSPALADLDGDGFLEIAFGCHDHKFYVLDHQGNTFVPNPNTKPKDLAPWPTYRQNNQRTGFYPGPPTSPPIPGDIVPPPNGNGIVDVDDLLAVINAWGPCSNPDNCPVDIAPPQIGNDTVDVDDLLMVINNWG